MIAEKKADLLQYTRDHNRLAFVIAKGSHVSKSSNTSKQKLLNAISNSTRMTRSASTERHKVVSRYERRLRQDGYHSVFSVAASRAIGSGALFTPKYNPRIRCSAGKVIEEDASPSLDQASCPSARKICIFSIAFEYIRLPTLRKKFYL